MLRSNFTEMETTRYTKTRDIKTKVLPGIRHSAHCGIYTIRQRLVEKRSEKRVYDEAVAGSSRGDFSASTQS